MEQFTVATPGSSFESLRVLAPVPRAASHPSRCAPVSAAHETVLLEAGVQRPSSPGANVPLNPVPPPVVPGQPQSPRGGTQRPALSVTTDVWLIANAEFSYELGQQKKTGST